MSNPSEGAGRISNIENTREAGNGPNPDISHVDRQEGEMNNGELGGNFGKEGDKEER